MLARDTESWRRFRPRSNGYDDTTALPPSVWVRFHRALSPFLSKKRVDDQPLMHFFHRQVAEVARLQHYTPIAFELHDALATYFDTLADIIATREPTYPRTAAFSELPYQFYRSGNRSRLDEILTSPSWMQQKLDEFGPDVSRHRLQAVCSHCDTRPHWSVN